MGVTSIIEIAVILRNAKNTEYVLSLFIIISGVTFTFELIVYCFLRGYDYQPMIIPRSPIDDGLAGNLFSQFSVTSTALLIAVLSLKKYWYIVFSAIYSFIEILFLRLGIYSHDWYRTWMTSVCVIVLFWLVEKTYRHSLIYKGRILPYFSMLFGLFTLQMPTAWWIQIVSGLIAPNTDILPDSMNSYALISIMNLSVLSISGLFLYYSNVRLYWKSIMILALYAILYLAFKLDLIFIKKGWFLVFASIDIWGMFLSIWSLDRLMVRGRRKKLPDEAV